MSNTQEAADIYAGEALPLEPVLVVTEVALNFDAESSDRTHIRRTASPCGWEANTTKKATNAYRRCHARLPWRTRHAAPRYRAIQDASEPREDNACVVPLRLPDPDSAGWRDRGRNGGAAIACVLAIERLCARVAPSASVVRGNAARVAMLSRTDHWQTIALRASQKSEENRRKEDLAPQGIRILGRSEAPGQAMVEPPRPPCSCPLGPCSPLPPCPLFPGQTTPMRLPCSRNRRRRNGSSRRRCGRPVFNRIAVHRFSSVFVRASLLVVAALPSPRGPSKSS